MVSSRIIGTTTPVNRSTALTQRSSNKTMDPTLDQRRTLDGTDVTRQGDTPPDMYMAKAKSWSSCASMTLTRRRVDCQPFLVTVKVTTTSVWRVAVVSIGSTYLPSES